MAAHHDKYGVANGIADNWTGVISVVSLAQFFRLNPPNHTMRFVLFAGEEKDLRGARMYVEKEKLTVSMVNLDTLGTAPLKMDSKSAASLHGPADNRGLVDDKLLKEAYVTVLNTVIELDQR